METKTNVKYVKPPTDKTVSRFDSCPCFDGRKSLLAIEPICWFCKYAKFDLNSDKLPEFGVCKYPEIQNQKEIKI
jgi:hypothetical protein